MLCSPTRATPVRETVPGPGPVCVPTPETDVTQWWCWCWCFWLAAAPQVGADPEAHAEESRDGGRPEGQATGTGQSRGRSRSSSRNLGRRRPLALLDLTELLGAAGLGHGLGQGEADAGDVGLVAQAQPGGAGDRGQDGVEGGVTED